MHGNVYQWCADWYYGNQYEHSPNADPTGPTRGSIRVHRGGNYAANAVGCRSAYRGTWGVGRRNYLGLRVCLVLAE